MPHAPIGRTQCGIPRLTGRRVVERLSHGILAPVFVARSQVLLSCFRLRCLFCFDAVTACYQSSHARRPTCTLQSCRCFFAISPVSYSTFSYTSLLSYSLAFIVVIFILPLIPHHHSSLLPSGFCVRVAERTYQAHCVLYSRAALHKLMDLKEKGVVFPAIYARHVIQRSARDKPYCRNSCLNEAWAHNMHSFIHDCHSDVHISSCSVTNH